jgi:uncharacterized repeat protein (TIGR01451 family)
VRITLTPDFVLTVEIDRNGGNNFQRVVGPLRLNQFPNQDPPETFKFGFASSTGDATNIHEIQNLVITSNAPPPDLQLTKRSNIDNVEPGGTVEYTLTVRNVGRGATTANATITDTLPPGFSFDSFRGAGWNCTADGRVVTCVYIGDPNSTNSATDPIISPNESQSVVVRVNAPDTPGNFTNTATVATTGDENPNNNTATDTVSIGGDTDGSGRPGRPRLRLVKRITRVNTTTFTDLVDEPGFRDDNPGIWPARLQPVGLPQIDDQSPLQSGDEVEYTVYFISDGGRNARNVSICDPIPQGTTFIRNSFGTGQGISLNLNRAEIPLTNASDPDQGTFFSPLAPVTAPCPNTNNPNGSVFLQLRNIQNDAPNNAGFVRFRVKID